MSAGRERAWAGAWGWTAGCAVVLAAPALAHAQQPAATAPLVFDGVTVVDVEQGKLIAEQRVVIAGNRIQAMGQRSATPTPRGARVVGARGKYLIPGLWDMHTHALEFTDVFYPLFIANGVTGIRDASSTVPLDSLIQWRREILQGQRVGPPRQLLSGQGINDGAPCVRADTKGQMLTCFTANDSVDAQHLVDSLKAAGVDIIKPYTLSERGYFLLAAAARRVRMLFGGHAEQVSASAASDSGAGLVDHIGYNEELDQNCFHAQANVEKCRPIAEHFRRNKTWWVPTWVNQQRIDGGLRSHEIYRRHDAFLQDFWTDTAVKSLYDYVHRKEITGYTSLLQDEYSQRPRHGSPIGDSLGYMYVPKHAGLPIIAGTDAQGHNSESAVLRPGGFTLQTELATYAAEGLSPLEALQTATLNPAKFLQATDSLGSVAPGKLADLVLLDADPLLDITNTMRIRAVVANGRYYERAALDRLFAEARANMRRHQ